MARWNSEDHGMPSIQLIQPPPPTPTHTQQVLKHKKEKGLSTTLVTSHMWLFTFKVFKIK